MHSTVSVTDEPFDNIAIMADKILAVNVNVVRSRSRNRSTSSGHNQNTPPNNMRENNKFKHNRKFGSVISDGIRRTTSNTSPPHSLRLKLKFKISSAHRS